MMNWTSMMMKTCVRLSVLCLLILATGNCIAESVYSDWIEEGDKVKLGDYKLEVVWTSDSAYFSDDGYTLDVPLGQCRSKDPFEICFDETRLTKDGEVVPDTINDPLAVTEMYIRVDSEPAIIEFTRTIAKTDLVIGEETKVEVIMENLGMMDATEVEFEDDFPDDFKVSEVSGCTLDDNEVTWNGIIRMGAEIKCEYTLTGIDSKSFSSRAELSYYNGMDDEKETDSQGLEVKDLPWKLRLTQTDPRSSLLRRCNWISRLRILMIL